MLEGIEVTYTRDYWAKRTVYIENIPLHHRTTHGIFHLIWNLSSSSDSFKIQSISFPSHHLDLEIEPSDPQSSRSSLRSKCKGFAFVVFSTLEDVDRFCTTWDWKRRQSKAGVETDSSFASASDTPSNAELTISEARKHDFRALPKIRWEQLKEEYLAWQQQLREQVLAEQDRQKEELASQMKEELGDEELHFKKQGRFEFDVVICCPPFITVILLLLLPSELSRILRLWPVEDFSRVANQGMDTCHVRFSSPSHAPALQKHSLRHHTVHDLTIGTEKAGASKHIEVEGIQGKKEEIYWEKVPMKNRRRRLPIPPNLHLRQRQMLQFFILRLSLQLSSLRTHHRILPTVWSSSGTSILGLTRQLFEHSLCILHAFFTNILSRRSKSGDTDNSRDFDIRSAIDYVDYTKGTDCCHLRLASSSNALALVERLKEDLVMQETPLDDAGGVNTNRSGSDATSSPRYVAAELVQGTREKFYWEKVPLKVRQEAARKANCADENLFASALNDHSLEALSGVALSILNAVRKAKTNQKVTGELAKLACNLVSLVLNIFKEPHPDSHTAQHEFPSILSNPTLGAHIEPSFESVVAGPSSWTVH
ncbi:hypothetical protein C8R42DRAFT_719781 [Lentinula raphanica]|nr:hypothetical protein C8R42DRAFT_719781 [Lentinula raphanica]